MSENPALVACIALRRQALLALQGSSAGKCAEKRAKVRRKRTHIDKGGTQMEKGDNDRRQTIRMVACVADCDA